MGVNPRLLGWSSQCEHNGPLRTKVRGEGKGYTPGFELDRPMSQGKQVLLEAGKERKAGSPGASGGSSPLLPVVAQEDPCWTSDPQNSRTQFFVVLNYNVCGHLFQQP